MLEQRLVDQRIGGKKNNLIDSQANQVHQREFAERSVERVVTRFGKRPQPIPRKVADDRARDRREVGEEFAPTKVEDQQIQHAKVNQRTQRADGGEFEKTGQLILMRDNEGGQFCQRSTSDGFL